MKRDEFRKLGKEWVALDAEYDAIIEQAFTTGNFWPETRRVQIRDMQKRLYELEEKLFKVASGEDQLTG